ncbi:unnamed protein product [Lathyrus sativus]|nr:unnamed protein product [Lathyrus sativus]
MSFIWILTLFLTIITLTIASNPNEQTLTGPNQQRPIHRKLSLGVGFSSAVVGVLGERHINPPTLRRPVIAFQNRINRKGGPVIRPEVPGIHVPAKDHIGSGRIPNFTIRPPHGL